MTVQDGGWVVGEVRQGERALDLDQHARQVCCRRPNDAFATVKTDRGDIRTKHVVHATNAFLGHLIPELRPYMSPVRATVIGRGSTGRRATADDSKMDLVAHVHLRGASPLVFDWNTDRIEVTHSWSGAVAFTQDGNPFVGRVPFSSTRH